MSKNNFFKQVCSRYNTLATNAQTLNVNLNNHVLSRSKAEVLHVVEILINLDIALSEIKVGRHWNKGPLLTRAFFYWGQLKTR